LQKTLQKVQPELKRLHIQDPEYETQANMLIKRARELKNYVITPVAVPFRNQEMQGEYLRTGMSSIIDIGDFVQRAYEKKSSGLFACMKAFYRR
jgi:hypothetical protein